MALRAKVLQTKARKFELKKSQVLKLNKDGISALEPLLQDVYASWRPKPTDYDVRRDLIRVFNEIAKEIYGNSKDIPVVVEFGSFVMDLFSTTSDLDLSVNFSTTAVDFPREKKIQTLRKFARKLYAIQSKGHVTGVLPITTAKVPILKCVDRGTGVECDISVENRDGILKSQIIHIISSIDERFHKLSFLMKTWAKAHNINSSKDKTLNSLSIILLVAFHLQAVLHMVESNFEYILSGFYFLNLLDGTDAATVLKSVRSFVNYGKSNRETLAELFATLLIKLSSVEKLWAKGLCASAYNGSWISKSWDSKVANISVEDFTDQSQNVARAVGQAEAKQIYRCIDISNRYISAFMDGKIGVELRELLFSQNGISNPIQRGTSILHMTAALPFQANHTRRAVTGKRRKPATHPDFSFTNSITSVESSAKKMRRDEGWSGVPNESWGATHVRNQHVEGSGGMYSRGWEGTQRPAAVGWGASQQPAAVGWEASQQPAAVGWAATYQTAVGGWRSTHLTAARSWGGTQQSAAGGWGGTQQHAAGGWGESQQPAAGGWGGRRQPGAGGWRGWNA